MQHIRIITQQVSKVFKSVKENYPKAESLKGKDQKRLQLFEKLLGP